MTAATKTFRVATCQLEGLGHLVQSKRDMDAPTGSKVAAYDRDNWKKKAHIRDGKVFVPGVAVKRALDETARLIKDKIPGKSGLTYHSAFLTGVLVAEDMIVGQEEDLRPENILCSSDGKKGGGGGKQVSRLFPCLDQWKGVLVATLLTDDIPNDIFERYVAEAGIRNGVGSFAPRTGGQNGRWMVRSVKWSKA